MNIHGSPLLSEKHDWKSGEELMEAACLYMSDVHGQLWKSLCTAVVITLAAICTYFSWRVDAVFCALPRDYLVFNQLQNLPYTCSLVVGRWRIENLDMKGIIDLSCRVIRVRVMNLKIEHKRAEITLIAKVHF